MDPEEVREHVQRSRSLIETSPEMNEENTKRKLVDPFLDLLDWNLLLPEVQHEYTVPMATAETYVDYALLVGDSPAVFVEAKAVHASLTPSNEEQLKSYLRQDLEVEWGILTNGREFHVLAKNLDGGSDGEISVAEFDLDDLYDAPETIEILTKEAIRTGRAAERAKQLARTKEAIGHLSRNENDVAGRVADVVDDEVGQVPLDLEEQARAFVRTLVSALEEQRQFVTDDDSGPRSDRTADDDDSDTDDVEGDDAGTDPVADHLAGRIARAELDGDADDRVAVFPMRPSGLTFLRENEAWGFVRVASEFEWVAMYVADDESAVRYVARAKDVVPPAEADLERPPSAYSDGDVDEGKQVVVFQSGTLYELSDPVPFETEYPQSLRYTTLGELRDAETTDDLF